MTNTMRKFTISDLATVLQIDPGLKEDLVKRFDSFDSDTQYRTQEILWDGLHELKEKLTELKYEQFLAEVDEGKRKLMSDLYDQAEEAVWQDFEDILSGKKKEKEQIENIISSIKTSVDKSISSSVPVSSQPAATPVTTPIANTQIPNPPSPIQKN